MLKFALAAVVALAVAAPAFAADTMAPAPKAHKAHKMGHHHHHKGGMKKMGKTPAATK